MANKYQDYIEHDELFLRAGAHYRIDSEFLKRQVWAESRGRHEVVSRAGARGLAQFMPATWEEWAPQGGCPFDPGAAIDTQARYMRWLLYRFNADFLAATAAYNAGPGRVRRLQDQHGADWERFLPSETLGYLEAVLGEEPPL